MQKKGTLGIIAVLVVAAALLGFANWLSSSKQSDDQQQNPATAAQHNNPPAPKFTEENLQAHWKQLIALSPSGPRGSADAPYTLVEIGDFQCPSCGKCKPLIDTILKTSDGKVKLYFINWPLTMIHPHAEIAAEAGESAAAQGKFWPMYDLLYAHQDQLIDSEIEYFSRDIPGLNTTKLADDMKSHKYQSNIKAQAAYVEMLGAISTPTFFVKGPDGHIAWYVGTQGQAPKIDGLITLASQPPWGNGIPETTAKQIVSAQSSS